MTLSPPSKEVLDQVRAEFGLDERGIKEAVQILKEWLILQPHLPHNCDDERLERWIIRCKNSLERTKASIDMYYTLKNVVPDILVDRDPSKPWFKTVSSVAYAFPLPKLRDDYSRVMLMGCLGPDPSNCNVCDILKMIFMIQEVRMCEDYCSSDVFVMDFRNFSIGHVTKITLPILKKMEVCAMKGYNIRLKEIHLVNIPSYADVVVNLVKSVLKPKIAARIHIHSKDMSTLHNKIPKILLPIDYNGDCGSINDQWSAWKKKLEKYRSWFLEQDNFKSDELKRPGNSFDSGELFGIEGSFRKLNID